MDIIVRVVLGLHMIMGYIALVVAPGAMLTLKGGLWQRRWGKIYFWVMAGVALRAFSVVNFVFLPPIIRWLWPTAIGPGNPHVDQLLSAEIQAQAYPIEASGGDVRWYEATTSWVVAPLKR
jgi:hypothetical protein